MQRVLVVDDDRDMLRLIQKVFGKYKDRFETITASDGMEAVEVLKYNPVSLVLTDIQMPRLNGMMLLAYVHTYHPDIPCIVMTAYGTSRLKERMPKDLLRFFQKQVEMKDLTHAVLAALKREGLQKKNRGISIVSFFEMIDMEKTSCIFEIKTKNNKTGIMYFEKGELFNAKVGELTGEAAALELIGSEVKSYRFKSVPDKEIPRSIKTDIEVLVRNAIGDGLKD